MPTPPGPTNFVYSGLALPAAKVNYDPVVDPIQNVWDQVAANDTLGGLADIRSQILSQWNLVAYGGDPTGGTDIYSAMTAACAAIVSAGGGILLIPQGAYALNSNFTVPIEVTLQFQNSIISVATGISLTINGPVIAPNAKIFAFSPSSSVASVQWGYQPQAINAQWWGLVPDGSTDNSPAFKQAFLAAFYAALELETRSGAYNQLSGRCPQVTIPQGVYYVGSTVEIPTFCVVQGLGKVSLTTSANIPIMRIAADYVTIRDLIFVGGQNSIILYGYSEYVDSLLAPAAIGNVPCIIEGCHFVYPTGPAIMQDVSPITSVAPASYGQTINSTPSTLSVVSTAQFPTTGAGTLTLVTNAGSLLQCSYTGISGNTFTGVTSSISGVMGSSTGFQVSLNTQCRTFQHTLKVSRCIFFGACVFWGCGDSVFFTDCHISFDLSATQATADGLPLGIFNSCDTLYLTNITAFGGGSVPARAMFVVGAGLVTIDNVGVGQNGVALVRQRTVANGYSNNGLLPLAVPFAFIEGGASNIPLQFSGHHLNCVTTDIFWAEIYEVAPAVLRISGRSVLADFDEVLGIWLDSGVSLPTAIEQGNNELIIDNDFPRYQSATGIGVFDSIFQGFDPGPSTNPTQALGTDVTAWFAPFRQSDHLQDMPVGLSFASNLFAYASADLSGVFGGVVGSSPGSPDTSTGYSVSVNLGGTSGLYIIPNSFALPSTLLPGIYCFSFYIKTNYAADMAVTIAPVSLHSQYVRHFEASDEWQRIEVPFFYQGLDATWTFHLAWYLPGAVTAWAGATLYAAGQRVVNGGNIYLAAVGGTSAGSGGPTGTGSAIVDGSGALRWNYVSAGATFTASTAIGLLAIHKGRKAAPYTFPQNADSATQFGYVPSIYYGTAAPTTGTYRVGDQLVLTNPAAGGYVGLICTTAGSPGTWKPFGQIGA